MLSIWKTRDVNSIAHQTNTYKADIKGITSHDTLTTINQLLTTRSFRPTPIRSDIGLGGTDHMEMYKPAVDIVLEALDKHTPICVCLDYDCDGQTAGACLIHTLEALGAEVTYVVPNRLTDGYGLKVELVKAKAKPKSLLITVDNGITNCEEVAALTKLGYKVLITDHHLPEGDLPEASYILNPKVYLAEDMDEYMAPGVYVAAKLALLVARAKLVTDDTTLTFEHPFYKLWHFCTCLTALGILSDIIELDDLMHYQLLLGMSELRCTTHDGLLALFDICKIRSNQPLTTTALSYLVVPKLNAAGRMGEAEMGLNLLLLECDGSTSKTASLLAANNLKNLNENRKIIEQSIFDEAKEQAESYLTHRSHSLIVYSDKWHLGVLGIVAARLVDEFNRPTLVLGRGTDGTINGSGRTVEGTDIFNAVEQCKDSLIKFGGHKGACGIALAEEHLLDLQDAFEAACSKLNLSEKEFEVDADVKVATLQDVEFQMFLNENFQPFGNLHPEINLKLTDVLVYQLEHRRDALYLVLEQDGYRVVVSKYKAPESWDIFSEQQVDVLISPTPLYYAGVTNMEYKLVDIRTHQ